MRSYVSSTLPGKLDQVYAAITSRAPAAHVVVLGYPHFCKLSDSCIPGLSEAKHAAINSAADPLNTTTAGVWSRRRGSRRGTAHALLGRAAAR
ncbi:hypothetical protein [Streptomyces sioyaensis]|uniref:hypothetical protein n=1 Tax=Streptomyces sioyaensis TaxID=67364 RepID=UPI003F541C3D